MTATALILFALLLTAMLLVLARLERRVDRDRDVRVEEAITEAKRTASHAPLMQHPLIDAVQCIGCGACIAACPEEEVLGLVEGKVALVNGARCLGHARCAEACPVGAIQVGLGELAARDDIPRLTDSMESSVPGLFLTGEVTGIALIRHAVGHGIKAVEEIAARVHAGMKSAAPGAHDLCIVGAGPAGLAAALKAVECGLDHVLLDQEEVGGTIRHYPRQKLVMTQPVSLPLYGRLKRHEYRKEELIQVWEEVVARFPLRLSAGERVLELQRVGDDFEVHTSNGIHRARFVLLALGRRGTPRKLGVPGEDSEKVAYRLVDAARYRDRHVLVVGGGDSAVEAAVGLAAQPGNQVTLSYRKDSFFRIKARNERKLRESAAAGEVRLELGSAVKEIAQEAVTLTDASGGAGSALALQNDFVFVFAGGIPPFDLLRRAGVAFGADAPPGRTEAPGAAADQPASMA